MADQQEGQISGVHGVNTDVAVWQCVLRQAGIICPHLLRTTQNSTPYGACQTNVSCRYRQQTACIITFIQFVVVCNCVVPVVDMAVAWLAA
jgi:hypothetical protein